ncbi:MAG: hypothetical protein K6356_14780 [Chloroflexus sp.]
MELTDQLKAELIATANALRGSERRIFMARTVKALGRGGQRLAERELGWNRTTIRKGLRELEQGLRCFDGHHLRGRKPVEARLPNLLRDIREIVEDWRKAHTECWADLRAPCLSLTEIREALVTQKGYDPAALPSNQTIAARLRALGYYPRRSIRYVRRRHTA